MRENFVKSEEESSEESEISLPLERRAMKPYTDKKGNNHEGIEEELTRLEEAPIKEVIVTNI